MGTLLAPRCGVGTPYLPIDGRLYGGYSHEICRCYPSLRLEEVDVISTNDQATVDLKVEARPSRSEPLFRSLVPVIYTAKVPC